MYYEDKSIRNQPTLHPTEIDRFFFYELNSSKILFDLKFEKKYYNKNIAIIENLLERFGNTQHICLREKST